MSFSLVEGWSEAEIKALVKAMCESTDPTCIMNMKPEHMYPTVLSEAEYEAMFGKEKSNAR